MKLFFRIIVIVSIIALPHIVHAATISLTNIPTTIGQQQQFYVDVTIDPQGKSINAIQGSIVFSSDNLSFVRAETGTSNITFFITPPTLKGNTITFAGIIPSGFNGLINPFDAQHREPGEIMRLVFMGKAAGEAQIIATGTTVADNNGQGTLEFVPDQRNFLSVSTTVSPSTYTTHDTKPPLITALVAQDTNLDNGKYALIFNAVDKQSGIDHVEVKEGGADWQTVQSPYVLHDQSRKSIILVRAIDVAGNTTLVTINAAPHADDSTFIVCFGLILLALILYFINKKYFHHDSEQIH